MCTYYSNNKGRRAGRQVGIKRDATTGRHVVVVVGKARQGKAGIIRREGSSLLLGGAGGGGGAYLGEL